MKKNQIILLAIAAVMFTGCAQPQNIQQCVVGEQAGFLSGLWHGWVAPISFICSLFDDEITVFAVNNNGGWYQFGFLIGAGVLFGSGSSATRRK